MMESIVMKELRETRDKISKDIKDMNTEQIKEYFKEDSEDFLKEIEKIRKQKTKAI